MDHLLVEHRIIHFMTRLPAFLDMKMWVHHDPMWRKLWGRHKRGLTVVQVPVTVRTVGKEQHGAGTTGGDGAAVECRSQAVSLGVVKGEEVKGTTRVLWTFVCFWVFSNTVTMYIFNMTGKKQRLPEDAFALKHADFSKRELGSLEIKQHRKKCAQVLDGAWW